MKGKNYNYIFVFYDVNEKRVAKVFKTCKKYLTHHQKSVFRGAITTSKLLKLEGDLNSIIDIEEDFVTFIKLVGEHAYDETTLGTNPKQPDGELFL